MSGNLFHAVLMSAFSTKPTDGIGGRFIAFHDISSKRLLRLRVQVNDSLNPCGIPQIPCAILLDVFSILPSFQTHCCKGSILACAGLPLIKPCNSLTHLL
ncbi:MAG TPA: hypothetical protein VG896_01230 [Candidatus Nitrosotalea sp.]|nr:hypothetical protein [Candidatus Nitrosotalea sp.]